MNSASDSSASPSANWDEAAARGLPSYFWRAGQERRLTLVRRWVKLEEQRVLDVGCGVGLYTSALMRYTPYVYGIEVEKARACEAHRHGAAVVQAPGERLPFADNVFDVVFSHEVLEHVGDDRACLREMTRVAKPGGYIVIFVPNRFYVFETHGVFWRGRYRFGNIPFVNWLPNVLRSRLAPHVRAYTVAELRRLLATLPVRVVHHTQIFPGYDNLTARSPRLGRMLRRVTYALEHTPVRLFALSHLVIAEKSASN